LRRLRIRTEDARQVSQASVLEAQNVEPIVGGGLSGLVPNRVDGVDVIRQRRDHDGARGVNDDQLIVAVHNRPDCFVGLFPHNKLSHTCALTALAFDDLVGLLQQTLAFAVFALGLLLYVRAFFIGHDVLQGCRRTTAGEGRALSL
jgi:hypothetical protein